jgi:uncharacterized protein YhaN
MRIAQLDLKAFGHFTGRRILFGEAPDFHIAYGPNEAGKTTISRALRAALFGIPERTSDNHLHANPNLRVGIVLASTTGERLAAMRRKARKNSLVCYDPATGEELAEAIPEERLAAWMGGLTEGLYTSMFGLDHDELVAGGRALSEGKGELGQSLFEAGAGLSSVRALRERLAKEADDLFRPRASTSAIYKVLEQYTESRREAKEAQTRPAEWEALRKAAEEAQAAYDGARQSQEVLQREARRLERLAAVLPDVAARALALERLAALGQVTRLPADATARRIGAQSQLRQAQLARDETAANRLRLEQEREAIALPHPLLEEAGAVEALYYALEAYRGAREGAASARGRMEQAAARAAVLLAAMGQAGCEDLRALIPVATLRARVQSQATQGATLRAEWDAAARQAAATAKELDELDGELAELGPLQVPATVLEALRIFASEGNPETQAAELARQVALTQADLEGEAAALLGEGSDGGDGVSALVAMGVPLPTELQRLRVAAEDLDIRRQSLRDKIETLENDSASVAGELDGLMQRGEVPTAEHLAQLRGVREDLWQRIRRRVFPAAGEPPEQEAPPPPTEYELAVQAADITADARFTDAARVSQHAELHKRLAQMKHTLDLEHGRSQALEQERCEWRRQWQTLLDQHRLPSLGTAELGDWLGRRDLFLQRHEACGKLKDQARVAAERTQGMRSRLSAALAEAALPGCAESETLAQALERMRTWVDQANKAAASHKVLGQRKKRAAEKFAEAQHQMREGEKRLADWREAWTQAMTAIRVASDAGAEEAGARLQQFDELERILDILDAARSDFTTAETTLERVEQEAARLCQTTGYQRANRPADAVAETLFAQLAEAKALAQRRKTLEDLIREAAKAPLKADQALRQAEGELSGLKAAAGCETPEALVAAETQSAECLRLEADIAAMEARLVLASALPLQDLLAQAEGQDLALVKAALQRAGGDLNACTAHVEALHARLIDARARLGKVDGAGAAADAEQRAAGAAARLSHLVADYASARLASAILVEVIETYQQRHQGPLLARASELFATITGGRFAKVATDFDEAMTILVAVRPNSRRETVGNLSSGTRDQLFLALRLAAIESHVAGEEPMPVVVDDIVINFDDASASATFRVLADLSRKTQVLFFTHHEHLLDQAAEAIGARCFRAHRF